MSQLRQDSTTGAWVLIAPERDRRPGFDQVERSIARPQPAFDPACPFCPGNERLLPGIVEEISSKEPPGWCVRVVPNRYPALRTDQTEAAPAPSGGPVAPAYGCHEVIIETVRHDADLTMLAAPDLAAVVRTYRQRHRALSARPGIRSVVLFRNHGGRAGASLLHPHSQAVALAMTPPRQAAMLAWARARYDQTGNCPVCSQLAVDLNDGRRVVETTERFALVVPFAAASPFELYITPRRHRASFGEAADDELIELGRLLQRTLRRLAAALGDPPYNFAVESVETGGGTVASPAWAHWRLRIMPRLVRPGGFELGSDLPINPSLPETDAEILRKVVASAQEEQA